MTDYILFVKMGDGAWLPGKDAVSASSPKAAIRKALAKSDKDVNGEWAAVPARSWNPVKVQVEQALKFS